MTFFMPLPGLQRPTLHSHRRYEQRDRLSRTAREHGQYSVSWVVTNDCLYLASNCGLSETYSGLSPQP